jgi:hypothetical protein
VDDAYFDSYSYFDIHHEMLSDKVNGPEGGGCCDRTGCTCSTVN